MELRIQNRIFILRVHINQTRKFEFSNENFISQSYFNTSKGRVLFVFVKNYT